MAAFRQHWHFVVLLLRPPNQQLKNRFQKSCGKVLLGISACFFVAFSFVSWRHIVLRANYQQGPHLQIVTGIRQAGVHPDSALEEQGLA